MHDLTEGFASVPMLLYACFYIIQERDSGTMSKARDKTPIYLDYNATAPLRPEVIALLTEKMGLAGNASSIHGFGRLVRKEIEAAREDVARLAGADSSHVVFTSGATEANNAVINGAPVQRFLYSAIEHPSVTDAALRRDNAYAVPVQPNGVIDLAALEEMLARDLGQTLVSVMWANNETGVIQPVAEISALAKKYGALFHCDAVQAAGRLPIDMAQSGIDYLTLSGHKIGGPAGIGALIYSHDTPLEKLIHGGGQEKRRRAGTENFLGALGFGSAATLAAGEVGRMDKIAKMRDELEEEMFLAVPRAEFIGRDAQRLPNTIQVILPGVPAETQLMSLDLGGIAVSSGSACSSGSVRPSHVLLAMGVSDQKARCALRISLGYATTPEEISRFLQLWVTNSQRYLGK
ncbi:MAG: cysteine desulfurase [Alphaproteobacteria bacterium]|nr:cysteine desulfurase [Alphaproteobacteria bacterium]